MSASTSSTADPGDDVLRLYGWGPRPAALLHGEPHPARVVRVDRDRCLVVTRSGEHPAALPVPPVPPVAVGDWVGLEPTEHTALPWRVAVVAERWSALERADPASRAVDFAQVLAADVDLVAVVHPLDRPVSVNRIERELAVVWDARATPVVVLTKADCHGDLDALLASLHHRLVGVDVLVTSALDGSGVEAVAELLRPDRTLMLFGASGAGKSTLANALLGEDRLATRGVRELDARGRHTTTARYLLPVPGGGVLLDTPGIRSLALLGGGGGVSTVFADLEQLATGCRFGDCGHHTEPGCAVQAAIEAGDLEAGRLQSWRKLQRELDQERRRADPLAAAAHHAEMRRWGRAMKQYRSSGRNRP